MQFVNDNPVIDMFAGPHGSGGAEEKHLHNDTERACEFGITECEKVLDAGSNGNSGQCHLGRKRKK